MSNETTLKPLAEPEESVAIVVIAAHHDDIEFGVSGSVAKWVKDGHTVTYVIITDGGSGSNVPGVVRSELTETRRVEQLAAAKAIGVEDVRFLGYHDGTLAPTMDLRRDLTRILREVKPYRVVCQDPTTVFAGDNYVNHPDHRAAGEAAIYATFPSSESRPIFPELLAEGYEPHKVGELLLNLSMNPNHFVDISETIDLKMDALRCHASQIGSGEDAEKGALKWIRFRNKESGKEVGVGYAEHFKLMKFDEPRPGTDEETEDATQEAMTDATNEAAESESS
ncbi:MAG: GlcNAc-PI de-N-acetylase [Anaerolineaceae bacterium]|nr:GlcNAc-PI de-N-acetylase [Anaerolineaceae bacterium]